MAAIQALTAGVLAGGEGARLGGADKGLALYRGLPLIRHVLTALEPQSSERIVSANRHLEIYASFGVRVVADTVGHGPLAGLAALLAAARHDWLLCVPCDAPTLPGDLAAGLWQAASTAGADAAVLHDGQHMHPTFCLVHTRLAGAAHSAAAASMGLSAWLSLQGAALLPGAAPPNLNTAADFALLEATP